MALTLRGGWTHFPTLILCGVGFSICIIAPSIVVHQAHALRQPHPLIQQKKEIYAADQSWSDQHRVVGTHHRALKLRVNKKKKQLKNDEMRKEH